MEFKNKLKNIESFSKFLKFLRKVEHSNCFLKAVFIVIDTNYSL